MIVCRSSFPPLSTKGVPVASSSSPGPSPRNKTLHGTSPSPRIAFFLLSRQSEHFSQLCISSWRFWTSVWVTCTLLGLYSLVFSGGFSRALFVPSQLSFTGQNNFRLHGVQECSYPYALVGIAIHHQCGNFEKGPQLVLSKDGHRPYLMVGFQGFFVDECLQ